MFLKQTINNNKNFLRRVDQFALWLTNIIMVSSLIVLIAVPFLAYRWAQLPFIGAFVEQTLVFNSVEEQGTTPWVGIEAGLKYPFQLISINGQDIRETDEITDILEDHIAGEEVSLLYRYQGKLNQLTIKLQKFPPFDFFAFFIVPYIIGWAYFLIGLWVFRIRWHNVTGRAFMIFCASMGIGIGSLFDLYTTHFFSWLWTLSIPIAAASLLTMSFVFPQEATWVRKYPILRWLGILPASTLILLSERVLYDFNNPFAYINAWQREYLFASLAILLFLGVAFYRHLRAPTPIVRDQARAILWGSVLAFSPIAYYLARATIEPIAFNVSAFLPPLVFFPLAIAYAILRHRLLNTDRLIAQGSAYVILAALTGVAYIFLTSIMHTITGIDLPADNSIITIGIIVTITLVFVYDPLRAWVQRNIDILFFRRARGLREHVWEFGHFLKTSVDFPQVVLALRHSLENTVRPAQAYLFARDEPSGSFKFYSIIPEREDTPSDMDFKGDGPLARLLEITKDTVYLTLDQSIPRELEPEREKLSRLNANIFLPFSSQSGLAGWLALGPSLTGEPYNRQDLIFLGSIGDQAASAIERAWLLAAEREQYNVIEALKDSAAALTSTLDYELVLDRILANVEQVVPHEAINIMLIDDGIVHVVRRRGDEKFTEEAIVLNRQMPVNQTPLLLKMSETGEPSIVHNTRDHPGWIDHPESRWVRSYLGVPIRSKGMVIGFLNLNSNIPDFFTSDHAKHLLAFADQAGSAIETSRLFNGLENANAELILAYDETLEGWSHALDLRDKETEGHSQRVTKITVHLAEAIGMQPEELVHIRRGALLHDIGKIGVPDQILHKTGPLTEEELKSMRQHPIYSYEMLSSIQYLRPAIDIPYSHHEHWDGSGYPQGLAGENIPLAARIFTIVDIWDSLITDRPYRLAWPPGKVIDHLKELSGTHLDPSLLEAFLNLDEVQQKLKNK